MKINYDNANTNDRWISLIGENLLDYIKQLQYITKNRNYNDWEGSINLPFDEDRISEILALKEAMVGENLKYIVVEGIGGSNLGAKAVYDALYGFYDNLQPKRLPRMLFSDTVNPDNSAKMQEFLEKEVKKPEEVLYVVISKSGKTIETIANMGIMLKKKFFPRTVVITGKNSPLWELAEKENLAKLEIPEKVGGRYSVFSASGLFPLACAGIDIVQLLEGAMESRQSGILDKIEKNPSALSAITIFKNYHEGKYINDNFMFSPQLESLGKWYRQLMGESLGKEHDVAGDTVYMGITPTVSVGSTDLHSVAQLYMGGPRDKIFTFVWVNHFSKDTYVNDALPSTVEGLKGKNSKKILTAIYSSTKHAYISKGIPFVEVILDRIDEKEIGAYMQFKMIEMMYLGKMLNINAFDQPNVEGYKVEAKELLKDI